METIADPVTHPYRRRVLALRVLPVAMYLAPILTGVASLLLPAAVDEELNTTAKLRSALDAVDGSRTRVYVAYVVVVFALIFLLPAWAGIVSLAPDSRLNLIGAALATIGVGAGVAINALTGLTLYVATDGKLGQGAGEAFMDRLWHGGVLPALFIPYLLLPVAALFATAGILRARAARWWEPVLWAIGLVLLFLSSGGWMGAVASAILLAGSLLLARRISRPLT